MSLSPALAALWLAMQATPPQGDPVAVLADTFRALCVEGRPSQEESARRALAAGFVESAGNGPGPVLPPGQRLSVMERRPGMIFGTMPPLRSAPTKLSCLVGLNLNQVLSLERLSAAVGTQLRLGPPSFELFGRQRAAYWRPEPGFTLIATPPSSNDGPLTHQLLAWRDLEPGH